MVASFGSRSISLIGFVVLVILTALPNLLLPANSEGQSYLGGPIQRRLAFTAFAQKVIGGRAYCVIPGKNLAVKKGRSTKSKGTRATERLFLKTSSRYIGSRKSQLKRATALVAHCRADQTARNNTQPVIDPDPTPTPTPTPLPPVLPTPIDNCRGDQFIWSVLKTTQMPAFDFASMPHMRDNRVVLVNMTWSGAMPSVVADTVDERFRLNWLGVPFVAGAGKLTVNTGTPINADLNFHKTQLLRDIDRVIPDPNFDGYVVLDSEVWWPQWDWNDQIWRDLAIAQVQAQNPSKTIEQVTAMARVLWNTRGLEFYLETQRVVQAARPHAKVGWFDAVYRAYWNGYDTANAATLRAINEQFMPVHNEADFVLSDIYQFYRSATLDNGMPMLRDGPLSTPVPNGTAWFDRNANYVFQNIQEAKRLAHLAGNKPVLAYIWPRYHDSAVPAERFKTVTQADLFVQMIYPLMLGVDHIAIWGNEMPYYGGPSQSGSMQQYMSSVMGPMLEAYCKDNLSDYQPILDQLIWP